MAENGSTEAARGSVPTGFIELNGQMLVVDFGKIYVENQIVANLFEDGTIQLL